MATIAQPQTIPSTGQAQVLQKGSVQIHPLMESRIIPSIQEHMENVDSKTFTAGDFSDEAKQPLNDPNQLQILTQKLKDLHLEASVLQLSDGNLGLRVTWESKGHAEEIGAEAEEEQPWELGEHPPVEAKAGGISGGEKGVPPSIFTGTRPVQIQQQQQQQQQQKPQQQQQQQQQQPSALASMAQSTQPAISQVPLPAQVFQGFGGGRGGRGGFRGRRGRGGFGISGAAAGLQAGIGAAQLGGQSGGAGQISGGAQISGAGGAGQVSGGGAGGQVQAGGFGGFNRQGIQGPFGRFAGYFFAGFPAPSRTPGSLQEFFQDLPSMVLVLDNWVKTRLVLIGDLQPLDKALQRMNRHRIVSVPVLDESTRQIRGVLDVGDVLHYLADLLDQPLNQALNLRWDFSVKDCGSLLETAKKPWVFSNQACLWDILNCISQKGNERVLIVDKVCEPHTLVKEESDVVGMLVQMDFIRFLSQHNAWLRMHPKFDMPLERAIDLNNLAERVITVTADELTYMAFRKMDENNVHGLAVVDDQGRVIANLSASNIRGISRRNFQVLRFPLGEFLRRDRRVGWWQTPIYVKASDPFGAVFYQFTSTGLHRQYILDDNNRPTHVITPTDMLKALTSM